MSLLGVRIGAAAIALIALAAVLYKRRAVEAGLHRFFLEPSPPTNLALLRVVVFVGLARVAVETSAAWWASVPDALRIMPPGWGWLGPVLPIDATLAGVLQVVLVLSSLSAALGFVTRVSAVLASVIAVYLLGLPSFFGTILVSDHTLVLMALVVAASPCGDALSIDRWGQRRHGVPACGPSPAYTLPIRLVWLLLGSVYLFPGLWKLWNNGDLWLSGERILWQLHAEWAQRDLFTPPMRLDESPTLLKVLGTATLVFEVGLFFAIFGRRTRSLAALAALAFHYGVQRFLGIAVYKYLPLVLLIDFPTFGPYKTAAPVNRSWRASAIVGGTLLAGQLFVGVARVETWPITLQPAFDERARSQLQTYVHQLALEPHIDAPSVNTGNVLVTLSKMPGLTRLFVSVDREIDKGNGAAARGTAFVALINDAGIALNPGDEIALYSLSWAIFPLGQQSEPHRVLIRRYRVDAARGIERIEPR